MPPFQQQITKITPIPYGVNIHGKWLDCHPTEDDIKRAIDNNELEKRSFQGNIKELETEFNQAKDIAECLYLNRKYHASRIANFVVNPSDEPITLQKDEITLTDGLHRYWAARYSKKETINAVII